MHEPPDVLVRTDQVEFATSCTQLLGGADQNAEGGRVDERHVSEIRQDVPGAKLEAADECVVESRRGEEVEVAPDGDHGTPHRRRRRLHDKRRSRVHSDPLFCAATLDVLLGRDCPVLAQHKGLDPDICPNSTCGCGWSSQKRGRSPQLQVPLSARTCVAVCGARSVALDCQHAKRRLFTRIVGGQHGLTAVDRTPSTGAIGLRMIVTTTATLLHDSLQPILTRVADNPQTSPSLASLRETSLRRRP